MKILEEKRLLTGPITNLPELESRAPNFSPLPQPLRLNISPQGLHTVEPLRVQPLRGQGGDHNVSRDWAIFQALPPPWGLVEAFQASKLPFREGARPAPLGG